jgi:bacillithiol biosynthesis cysteine-adding enzyme BshC
LTYLLQDYGVVFLTANTPAIKRLLSPMFVRELEEFPRTSQLVISRSAEIEKTYHAQIKPKSINLFMFHKGGRYAIEPRETDFSLKGTRHFLQPDEILRMAKEQPDVFSPNVVLRPLAQDSILPTVVYVGGPAEIAYHAQLQPVYDAFQVTQPVLFPRASATIVEERLRRIADKYGLSIAEFFQQPDQIMPRILDQIADVKVEAMFKETHGRLKDALNELRFGLRELDPTLLGALDGVNERLVKNLDVLRGKATEAQKRRNDTAVRQLERASQALIPGGGLQERQLSVLHYLNRYGTDLVRWLESELDIHGFKHQLLFI